MKTIIGVICTLLIGLTLNVEIALSEDQTHTNQTKEPKERELNTYKTRVDPAREARRMNYLRGRMALPERPRVEENALAEDLTHMSITEDEWPEPMEIKLPKKTHKIFRKQ